MASGLPITAILLASVAGSTVLAVALAPPTHWLAPDMRPLALGLSAAWAAWRLLALDRALAQYRAWHHAPGWMVAPEALPAETAPAWWPAWYRRGRRQVHCHQGVLVGRAFRWQAGHTQVLETAPLNLSEFVAA